MTIVLFMLVCTILAVLVLPNYVAFIEEFHLDSQLPFRILLAVGSFAGVWKMQILVICYSIAVGVLVLPWVRRGRVRP
jgi:type II secretory pathway component PulF